MTKISSHTDLMHLRNEKQRYLPSRLIMYNTHICIVKDYPYRMFSETFKLEKCKRTMGNKQISPKTQPKINHINSKTVLFQKAAIKFKKRNKRTKLLEKFILGSKVK